MESDHGGWWYNGLKQMYRGLHLHVGLRRAVIGETICKAYAGEF